MAHCPRAQKIVSGVVRYNEAIDLRKYAVNNPDKVQFIHASGFLLVLNPGVTPDITAIAQAVKIVDLF